MSFLIDGPWLYATGRAYAELAPEEWTEQRAAALGAATMAGFWATSISLYADRRWTRPIWRLCRAASGRDWMINSGVLRIDSARAGRGTHAVAAVLFALYPVALVAGYRRGRR